MTVWILAALALLALSACEPVAPDRGAVGLTPDRAAVLFADHCAICHGGDGSGEGLRRGSLHVKPPDFRRASWRRGRSVASLRAAIRDGKPGSDMPGWKQLGEPEIEALAALVLSFSEPVTRR